MSKKVNLIVAFVAVFFVAIVGYELLGVRTLLGFENETPTEETTNTAPVITATDLVFTNGDVVNPMLDVSASDLEDGDLSVSISDSNLPQTSIDGFYYVTYQATDSEGLSTQKTVAVTIDKGKPNVQPVPGLSMNFLVGDEMPDWRDYFIATDTLEGEITIDNNMVVSHVDMNTPGIYEVKVTVTDSSLNKDEASIVVTVSDTETPVIYLSEAVVELPVGTSPLTEQEWRDYILSCDDNVDVDFDDDILISFDTVDYQSPGSYLVSYSYLDSSGNNGLQQLTVTIEDLNAPEVMLTSNSILVERTDTILQVDLEALIVSVIDDVDGDLSGSVTINMSSLDTDVVGEYTVYYSVMDSSDNEIIEELTVTVEDTTLPVITSSPTSNQTGLYTLTVNEEISSYSLDRGETWVDVDIPTTFIAFEFDVLDTYEFLVKDLSDNESLAYRTYAYVDTTNPTIISSSTTDETGEYQLESNELIYEYSLDNGSTWVEVDEPSTVLVLTFDELGFHYLEVKDWADNTSSSSVYYRYEDNTDPTITSTDESGSLGVYSLELDENIYAYRINGGSLVVLDLETPTDSFDIVFETTGIYTIQAYDFGSNLATNSVTYTFTDITVPTITSSNVTNETGLYTITSADFIKGYSYDNGLTWYEVTEAAKSVEIDLEENIGTHTIVIKDRGGNISSNTVIYTFNDTVAPNIISPNNVTNSSTYTIESNESIYRYSTDGGSTWTDIGTPDKSHTINLSVGSYTIVVEDKGGNESNSITYKKE